MQASKITLGEQYAYPHNGEERAFIVTEIITRKNHKKTSSSVSGYYIEFGEADEKRVMLNNIDVADLIGDWTKHEALKAEEKRVAAARAAVAAEKKAKTYKAIDLLAAAIGAQAVHEKYAGYGADAKLKFVKWDEHAPAVMAHYNTIEINELAVDLIINYFNPDLDRNGDPVSK